MAAELPAAQELAGTLTPSSSLPASPSPGHYRVNGREVPFQTTAEEGVKTLLLWMGEDPQREGLRDTPNRVVRALQEMTQGYRENPAEILSRVFAEPYDEMIVVREIPFTSLCEHHVLTFSGTVDVGYLPNGKVVGLSKLARLVDCFSRRLQVQERLTKQIAEAIQTHLQVQGVGVVVKAQHSCMGCRGVRKPGAEMVTSVLLGLFRSQPEVRQEFLSLCGGGR